MYTIVICPNCEHVNTVKDVPNRTTCDRCQKSKKFKDLRHYFQTESRAEASVARAKIVAKLQDNEDVFERAFDSGVLTEEVESVVDDDELLRKHGINPEDAKSTAEESVSSNRSKSQKEIMEESITEQDDPTRDDILEYAEDHGVPQDKAENLLQKLRNSNEVTVNSSGAYRFL